MSAMNLDSERPIDHPHGSHMKLRVEVEPCKAGDLQPGDLFSLVNGAYWDTFFDQRDLVGGRVYIRSAAPCPPRDRDVDLFRITSIRTEP